MVFEHSIFGHPLIVKMAEDRCCPNAISLEDGRVIYTSDLVTHGKGRWQYQTWDKSWDPSCDPEAIRVLQGIGFMPEGLIRRTLD